VVRRRLLTLLLAVVLLALSGCGASGKSAGPDPSREPLAYVSPRAALVAVVSTDPEHGQGKAARELLGPNTVAAVLEHLRGASRVDIEPALGHDVVFSAPTGAAVRAHDLLLSTVAGDAEKLRKAADGWRRTGAYRGATLYEPAPDVHAALRGSVLLVAHNPAQLHRALDLRARGGGLSPTALRGRLGALPVGALVRVVGDARAMLAAGRFRDPLNLKDSRWVKSFRRFAATASVVPQGIRLRLHVDADPRGLSADDVPIPPGTIAAAPAGDAPLVAAMRDGSHLLRFLERAYGQVDPDDAGKLDAAKLALRIIGVDVDDDIVRQVGATTLLSRDLRHFTLRADLRDPKKVAHALDRLAGVASKFLGIAGLRDFTLDRQANDVFGLTYEGQPFARLAVIGRALVFTTDLSADLRAVAAARRAPFKKPAPGALALRLKGAALRDFLARTFHLPALARLALVRVGDATAAVQAAPDHLDATALIAIAR
jgi:hypothetical protein